MLSHPNNRDFIAEFICGISEMGERHSADKGVIAYSSSGTGVFIPGYVQV